MRRLRSIVREEGGAATLEFTLSALVLLMVIFGAMDVARAGYVFHFVSYAAQRGTRYAVVRGASWGSTTCASTTTVACNATSNNVQSYVRSLSVPGITSGNITVATTWPGTTLSGTTCSTVNAAGCLVQVRVSYSFSYLMSFLPGTALTFTGTSKAVIQR